MTETATRRGVRAVGWVFGLCSLVLVPWTVHLALTLPERSTAAHYDLAWSGFDVGLLLALAWTAWGAVRASRWLPVAASATAALLVVDAWFDVVTSPTRAERWTAVGLAAFVELPLVGVCGWLAVNGQLLHERRLARARRLAPRPRP